MAEEGNSIDSIGAAGSVDSADHGSLSTAALRPRPPSAQEIQSAVNKLNVDLSSVSRVLELTVDPASGLTVATVKDSQTGVVLQQFPGADSLQLAAMLAQWSGDKNALLDLIA
jgi:uncharacterized FlaG/YvyC family protein